MANLNQLSSSSIARASVYDFASIHLLPFMTQLNVEIEPDYVYNNKFFLSLCAHFSNFIEDPELRMLLLEAPPRSGKTEFIFTVVLPFIIGNNPNKRIMVITSTKPTKDHLRRMLVRVLNSEYYRKVFPQLGKINSSAERIEMPNGCFILFTTTLSTVPTGSGFHFIVASDYISASWIHSPANMTTAFQNWEGFASRKQQNPPTKMIIDNQRLNYYDLSWKIASAAERQGETIKRITFPYQFEEDYKEKLPNNLSLRFKRGEFLLDDIYDKNGDLLLKGRFNEREKRVILATTSEETYRIQYQQQPIKDRGKIFNRAYFNYYNQNALVDKDFVEGFITTDVAFKRTTKADFTVFMFWLVDRLGNLYLIDMFRDKVDGLDLNKSLYGFHQKWKDGINGNGSCDKVIIETAGGTNSQFISMLRNGFPIVKNGPDVFLQCAIKEVIRKIDKPARARQSLGYLQGGKVLLPSYDVKINGVKNVQNDIVEPLLDEVDQFSDDDSHRHDDMVDCLIDAVNEVNARAAVFAAVDVDRF